MYSYWEKTVFFDKKDLVIIGGGIVGLNSALEIKKKLPHLNLLVIERDAIGAGASSKNAGFACFGSLSEILSDLEKTSEEEVFELLDRRKKGIEIIEKEFGDVIDYQNVGGFELFRPEEENIFQNCLSNIDKLNAHFKQEVYQTVPNTFGFNNTSHIIKNNLEGHINTGKYVKALIDKCADAQIQILRSYEVEELISNENQVDIKLNKGLTISSQEVLVCTNGLTQKILPNSAVEPARAQVLVTSPIKNLPFKGTFHYKEGFYYFRDLADGRVLFGGARETAMDEERTFDIQTTPKIMNTLKTLLKDVILPGHNFTIDYEWAGIMGIGNSKQIIEKEVQPGVYTSVRLGGMGVALGGEVAKRNAVYYINKFS